MTIKSLTILDIDLIDSNEAILILNNLPNVQILNGKSTKEDDEEEYEDDEKDYNETDNNSINKGNKKYQKMEEIIEDKNMESNSNYISNENNNNTNNKLTPKSEEKNDINGNININQPKKINEEIPIKEEENTDNINKNKLLYNKIISDTPFKKIIISSTDSNNSKEYNDKSFNYFHDFIIDITNEELNLLNEEKNKFPIFLQEFNELFTQDEENTLLDNYNKKINDIENKKKALPNYYYFYLILKKKLSILKNLFDEIFPFILNNCPELNKNDIFIKLYTEVLNIISSSKQLMLTLHKHIEIFNNKKTIDNQNETNYNIELNRLITEKNETISQMKEENSNLLRLFNDDKNKYESKINSLQKENEIISNKLLNNINLTINSPYTTIDSGNKKINVFNNNILIENNFKSKTPNRIEIKLNNDKNIENKRINKSPTKSVQSGFSNNNIYLQTFNSGYIATKQAISLKALKEFINELYISKTNYNIKCEQFKLPKETMEEHMYTYLYKKYGLKNLVIDWARNVIHGIKKYSKIDSTVLLFGKILKNEQEEDSRFIIQKLSKSIQDLLKFYLKRQNPLKSMKELNKIFELKKKSELFEEEWKGMIYSIYEKKEAEEIQAKIEIFINKENQKKKSEIFIKYKNDKITMYNKYNNNINNILHYNSKNESSFYYNTINSFNNGLSNISFNNNIALSPKSNYNNKITRSERYNMLLLSDNKNIKYKDFLRIVLNSHIRFRDQQLKNFVQIFQSVDTDRDGVLNEEEFWELMQKTGVFKEDEIESKMLYFLEKIDPFDNQKITFSECVSFFSEEFVKDENGNEVSILEKICFNNRNNEEKINENNNDISNQQNDQNNQDK